MIEFLERTAGEWSPMSSRTLLLARCTSAECVRCNACGADVCLLCCLWCFLPSRRCLWPSYGSRIKSVKHAQHPSKMHYTPVILTQSCVAHPASSTSHRNSSIFSINREKSTWYIHQQQQSCIKQQQSKRRIMNNSSSANDEPTSKNVPRDDKAACWVRSARSEFYLECKLRARFILNANCVRVLHPQAEGGGGGEASGRGIFSVTSGRASPHRRRRRRRHRQAQQQGNLLGGRQQQRGRCVRVLVWVHAS